MKLLTLTLSALLIAGTSLSASAHDRVNFSVSYGTPAYYAAPVQYQRAPVVVYHDAPAVYYRQAPQVIYAQPVSYSSVTYRSNDFYDRDDRGRGRRCGHGRGWR